MSSENDLVSLPDRALRELDVEVLRAHDDIGELHPTHAPFRDGVKYYRAFVLALGGTHYGLHYDEASGGWRLDAEGDDRESVLAAHEAWLEEHDFRDGT